MDSQMAMGVQLSSYIQKEAEGWICWHPGHHFCRAWIDRQSFLSMACRWGTNSYTELKKMETIKEKKNKKKIPEQSTSQSSHSCPAKCPRSTKDPASEMMERNRSVGGLLLIASCLMERGICFVGRASRPECPQQNKIFERIRWKTTQLFQAAVLAASGVSEGGFVVAAVPWAVREGVRGAKLPCCNLWLIVCQHFCMISSLCGYLEIIRLPSLSNALYPASAWLHFTEGKAEGRNMMDLPITYSNKYKVAKSPS